jgi:hypothetical protein
VTGMITYFDLRVDPHQAGGAGVVTSQRFGHQQLIINKKDKILIRTFNLYLTFGEKKCSTKPVVWTSRSI